MTKNEDSAPLPSPAAIAAADDMTFAAIEDAADLAASFARSAGEAAFRRERVTLGVHLRQLRLVVIAAIGAFNELSAKAGEKAEAA